MSSLKPLFLICKVVIPSHKAGKMWPSTLWEVGWEWGPMLILHLYFSSPFLYRHAVLCDFFKPFPSYILFRNIFFFFWLLLFFKAAPLHMKVPRSGDWIQDTAVIFAIAVTMPDPLTHCTGLGSCLEIYASTAPEPVQLGS